MKAYLPQLTLVASASFVFVAASIGQDSSPELQGSIQVEVPSSASNLRDIAKSLAGRQVSENFSISLNAREAADFLLTPAILTQEALTDGVVLTYPSE